MTLDRVLFCVGRENLKGLQVVSLDSPTPAKTDVEDIDFVCLFRFHATRIEGPISRIEIRSDPLPSGEYSPNTPFTTDVDRRMLFLPIFLRDLVDVSEMVTISGEFLMQNLKSLPSTAKKEISLEEIWSSGKMPFTVIRILEGFDEIWQSNVYGSRMINTFTATFPMFYTLNCDRFINYRPSDPSGFHSSQITADIDGSTLPLSSYFDPGPAFIRTKSSLPELSLVQHGPFELLQNEKLDQCEAAMMTEDNIIFVEQVGYDSF